MEKNGKFRRALEVVFSHEALRMVLLIMVTLRSCLFLNMYVGPLVKFTLIWSAAILVKDLFTERLLFTNRFRGFLYLFLILYAGTALVMRGSNFARNGVSLLYMTTNLMVMYAYDLKKDRRTVKEEILRLSHVFLYVTFGGNLVSLLAFVLNIHYRFTYFSGGEEVQCWFGFYSGRMWGFFSNPNTSSDFAVLNVMLMMICLVILGRSISKGKKRFYAANFVVQTLIFFLANSRTAWLCMTFYLLVVPFFLLMTIKDKRESFTFLKGMKMGAMAKRTAAVAVIAALCFTGANTFAKSVLPHLVIDTTFFSRQLAQLPGSDSPDPEEDPEEFDVPTDLERDQFGSKLGGRYYLWKAGLKIVKNHPVLGVGSANVADYAVKYSLAPEMVGVDPDSEEYEAPYLPGIQNGGMHNMIMQVAVCSGLLGLLVIGAMVVCFLVRMILYFVRACKRKKVEPVTTVLAAAILTILCRSMTEIGLLYSVYYSSVLFWSLAGYLMYFIEKAAKEDPELKLDEEPLLAKLSYKLFDRKKAGGTERG